jgi:hypothetical protein
MPVARSDRRSSCTIGCTQSVAHATRSAPTGSPQSDSALARRPSALRCRSASIRVMPSARFVAAVRTVVRALASRLPTDER